MIPRTPRTDTFFAGGYSTNQMESWHIRYGALSPEDSARPPFMVNFYSEWMNILDFPCRLCIFVLRLSWKIQSLHTLECPSLLQKQAWMPLILSADSKEVEGCYGSSSTKKTAPLLTAAEQGHVEAESAPHHVLSRSFNIP